MRAYVLSVALVLATATVARAQPVAGKFALTGKQDPGATTTVALVVKPIAGGRVQVTRTARTGTKTTTWTAEAAGVTALDLRYRVPAAGGTNELSASYRLSPDGLAVTETWTT